MHEIVDKSTGAILFKKTQEELAMDLKVSKMEKELEEMKKQLAKLLKK